MDKNVLPKETSEKMSQEVERFKAEIKKIHTGRATPVLVENLMVDYYGSKAPIKQVASINIPEPRVIAISPWNKDDLVSIEKAVAESDLKVNPQNDGVVVRIVLPALTEERRKELVKILNKEKEKSRINVRRIREEVVEGIKKADEREISEDDKFSLKEEVQRIVEEANKELDAVAQQKEKEIMAV